MPRKPSKCSKFCGLDQLLSETSQKQRKTNNAFCKIIDLNLEKKNSQVLIPEDFLLAFEFQLALFWS